MRRFAGIELMGHEIPAPQLQSAKGIRDTTINAGSGPLSFIRVTLFAIKPAVFGRVKNFVRR
jgi:hypothetical protein